MDRDRRLTGFLRGQSDEVEAPLGFELNNPWRVSAFSGYEVVMRMGIVLMVCRWRNGSFRRWCGGSNFTMFLCQRNDRASFRAAAVIES